MILVLSTHGVLPSGTARILAKNADAIHDYGTLTLFVSAIFAGALITAMTWSSKGRIRRPLRVDVHSR
jgi:hypothetical protein